jgi:hypothetical protein
MHYEPNLFRMDTIKKRWISDFNVHSKQLPIHSLDFTSSHDTCFYNGDWDNVLSNLVCDKMLILFEGLPLVINPSILFTFPLSSVHNTAVRIALAVTLRFTDAGRVTMSITTAVRIATSIASRSADAGRITTAIAVGTSAATGENACKSNECEEGGKEKIFE